MTENFVSGGERINSLQYAMMNVWNISLLHFGQMHVYFIISTIKNGLFFLIQFHVKMSLSTACKNGQDDITNFELKQKFDKASMLRNTFFHSNTMFLQMLLSYTTAECVFTLAIALAFSFTPSSVFLGPQANTAAFLL